MLSLYSIQGLIEFNSSQQIIAQQREISRKIWWSYLLITNERCLVLQRHIYNFLWRGNTKSTKPFQIGKSLHCRYNFYIQAISIVKNLSCRRGAMKTRHTYITQLGLLQFLTLLQATTRQRAKILKIFASRSQSWVVMWQSKRFWRQNGVRMSRQLWREPSSPTEISNMLVVDPSMYGPQYAIVLLYFRSEVWG